MKYGVMYALGVFSHWMVVASSVDAGEALVISGIASYVTFGAAIPKIRPRVIAPPLGHATNGLFRIQSGHPTGPSVRVKGRSFLVTRAASSSKHFC